MPNSSCDLLVRHAPHSALPDRRHTPSVGLQRQAVASIARDVQFKLLPPEPGVRRGRRRGRASLVTVPEAALHEYDSPKPWKHQVRPTRQCADVQPVTKARRVQRRPHAALGLGVAPANPCHHARPGGAVFAGSATSQLDLRQVCRPLPSGPDIGR